MILEMHYNLSTLPRKFKILIMVASDVILLPLALWSAVALRYGSFSPDVSNYQWLFFLLPFFTVPLLLKFGLYRAVIRYIDEQIIKTVLIGVTLSVLILTTIVVMAQVTGLPRSSIIIYWVLAISYIAFSRYCARGIMRTLQRRERRKSLVAIYGAGQAGLQTALALMSGPEYKPVMFFDDNPELHGASVAGIRIYNPRDAIELMDKFGCYQLLLALPSASRFRRKEIIQQFEGQNIQLKTIPGMGELVKGSVAIQDIREVGIEDLLGRDPVPPYEDLFSSCIMNKSVLVTGAGGSIGSELCRQILKNKPSRLILFERSEYSLYLIEQEFRALAGNTEIVPVLGDILDNELLKEVLAQYQVQTIYHAAAYKHVPLVERNIIAGVRNNVFGTLSVAQAALEQKIKTFVLISTDKAVRPTNIMGATKRMAELVLQALADENSRQTEQTTKTSFSMVRFGNVLGSSGSVVPLFKEQIKKGGPITVTHTEVTRFFMTIPEAAQLVIQAGAMGYAKNQSGDVYVLDMGEPVKIVDLAKKLIELSGFTLKDPNTGEGDIAIEVVGMRPGEKLYEELLIGSNVSATRHPRIMKAQEDFIEKTELMKLLHQLKVVCDQGDVKAVVQLVIQIVKEYQPQIKI